MNASRTRLYGACVTPSVAAAGATSAWRSSRRSGRTSRSSQPRCASLTPNASMRQTGQIERTDGVVEVEPAEFFGEVAVERLGVQRLAGHPDLRRTAEVAERIARARRGVVVGAVDEHPGDAAKRVERGAESAESMLVAEVVARVHDEVGPPGLRKRRHPPLLAMLPGGHMSVGEVEHPHGRGAGRQDARVVLTDREQVALDADAPDRSARADRPHRSESGEGGLGVRVRH